MKTNNSILWKYLLLVLTVLLMACNDDDPVGKEIEEEDDAPIEVTTGTTLAGEVLDENGNPIQGIVVSDGYSVVTTNKDGVYEIKRNKLAKFVFVSIPEDRKIPTEKNIPQFYKPINQEKEVVFAHFKLEKKEKDTDFILLAIADPQPSDYFEMERFTRETVVDINSHFVKYAGKPVYGITVGDIVWDKMNLFQHYINAVSRLSFPIFQVIGNHDHNENIVNNDYLASKDYEDHFGPTYYSYNIGDCHFIVLDDVYYTDRESYKATITQEQLDWLKKDLEHVSKDKQIILGTHIPTKRRNSGGQVSNNAELYALLDGYKVRIISGHVHANFTTTISPTIEENSLGAAMGAFWYGDICPDGSPNGYAVYEIKGNKIDNWYYKGTDLDEKVQMKVYPPAAMNDFPSNYPAFGDFLRVNSSVMINVYNWHTTWNIKIEEDGVAKGSPRRYNFYDPLAVLDLFGEGKPSRHPVAAEPSRTDHLFYYTPSSKTWQKVKVTVTDAHGNIYTEEVENTNIDPIDPAPEELPEGVYFLENFEWLLPWSEAGKAGRTVEDDNISATAPQLPSPVANGISALAALQGRGYQFLRVTTKNDGECIYLQKNYLKFGKTSYQAGIILPSIEDVPADAETVLSFDWCPMRQGSGTIDVVNLIVIVANEGNEVTFSIPESEFEKGQKLEWIKAEVPLTGVKITKDTKITIRQTQWPEATANRWFLDNIKIAKAE